MRRRFRPSGFDNVEELEEYRPGGLHPIAIGDTFASGRYRILSKLGSGGTSTVWLVRDQQPSTSGGLMALKVMSARFSASPTEEIAELQIPRKLQDFADAHKIRPTQPHVPWQAVEDTFMHDGPNGSHICLVSQFLGPSIQSMLYCPGGEIWTRRLRSDLARKVAKQVASAIQLMHSAGYAYGDLAPSNILFRLRNHVRHWSDEEVCASFGEPVTEDMITLDHSSLEPHAPLEIVASIPCDLLSSPSLLQEEVTIIDFEQSFFMHHMPEGYVPATTIHCTPPEVHFESKISSASDIWSLACTIFHIRVGFPLFDSFFGSSDDILLQTVSMLGKPPDPWWDVLKQHAFWGKASDEPRPLDAQNHENALLPAARSAIRDQLRKIGEHDTPPISDEGPMFEKTGTRLEEVEVELLGSLLEQMLRYRPEDRITIQDVLCHPWFNQAEAR